MLELNAYTAVLLPLALAVLYAVRLRLQKPLEYRHLSSHVPSVTKTFWSEVRMTWILGTKKPIELLPFLEGLIRKNGPVVHFSLSGRAYVLLNDPDDIKILLSSTQNIKKGPEYDMLKPWLNEGLLLSTGAKWMSRRRLLTNTFHFKTLRMYNPSINKHAQVFTKRLLEEPKNNVVNNVMDYVTLCSLDIICETIMGTEMNSQDGKSVQYVQSIKKACKSTIERVFKFWLWNDLIFGISKHGRTFYESIKVLHSFTDEVIKNKRLSLINSKSEKLEYDNTNEKNQKKSFLDILFSVLEDDPEQMTDKDIREEVDTFLFEGHDTSSLALAMTLVLLGIYKDIQNKARDEVISIMGDSDRDATIEDLNNMKYLDAVVKESLRLYPSVPGITRELSTPLQLKNYTIPPLTIVAVYPYILHRTESIFENPKEFVPERFLGENNKSKFIFGYLPFSAGPRNCIGQKYVMNQLKSVISSVLRRTKFETLGTIEDIQMSTQLVLRIESVPKMKFYKI